VIGIAEPTRATFMRPGLVLAVVDDRRLGYVGRVAVGRNELEALEPVVGEFGHDIAPCAGAGRAAPKSLRRSYSDIRTIPARITSAPRRRLPTQELSCPTRNRGDVHRVDRVGPISTAARREGKRLRRPKAPALKVAAAIERVRGGASIREAVKAAGVNRETVRRAVLSS
jgi:hypothetical protein